MPYWYRPQLSREEAISFVRDLDPGSFIIRDSVTVQGGYALTIKISQDLVRQRRKIAEGMLSGPVNKNGMSGLWPRTLRHAISFYKLFLSLIHGRENFCCILQYLMEIAIVSSITVEVQCDTSHPSLPLGAPVTEDLLITHFLIQPDPEGVKLQGWNKRAFSES